MTVVIRLPEIRLNIELWSCAPRGTWDSKAMDLLFLPPPQPATGAHSQSMFSHCEAGHDTLGLIKRAHLYVFHAND